MTVRAIQRMQRLQPPALLITSDAVHDPTRLTRILHDMQTRTNSVYQTVRENPLASPTLLRGVQVTSGTNVVLAHQLGRGWTAWWVVRAWPGSNPPAFVEAPLSAYGARTTAQVLILVPTCSGNYDFAVVGD